VRALPRNREAMSRTPECIVSLKQGQRGWATWRTASPQAQMSPIPTALSVMPSVVRFSPKKAGTMSGRSSSARQAGRCSEA
jgi:hypothetical protein